MGPPKVLNTKTNVPETTKFMLSKPIKPNSY
jgi:hypothetical protein